MKFTVIVFGVLSFCKISNAQSFGDTEAAIKYPDDLVCDKTLMNYTIYKPNTNIACIYAMKQVSKTPQRTVFINEDSSIKMSFAFFDLKKMPFYIDGDSAYESSYKFFVWDSTARARANMPAITVFQSDRQKGILYFRESTENKTRLYLAGTKNNLLSLIMFSEKDMVPEKHLGNMDISYKLNSQN